MSRAIAVFHGRFGRATIYRLNRPFNLHAHREGHLIFHLAGENASRCGRSCVSSRAKPSSPSVRGSRTTSSRRTSTPAPCSSSFTSSRTGSTRAAAPTGFGPAVPSTSFDADGFAKHTDLQVRGRKSRRERRGVVVWALRARTGGASAIIHRWVARVGCRQAAPASALAPRARAACARTSEGGGG
jgi:hypothetical protein